MPPASSHLAERPVPAPPPMMGSPRAIMPRSRSRMSLRGMRAMALPCCRGAREARAGDVVEVLDQGVDEGLVVDVVRKNEQLAVCAGPETRRQHLEQLLVGRRIPERLARRVDQRDAALRDQE